ncbi:MAG: ribose-5-phosphate isomerase RpiA [Acidiferrobacterales bacterium]|nr:ribose-5-phosphate isomerase RpiA [Acidiferrobacterales bacterium]
MKHAAAQAALDQVELGDIVGVGTGSTANIFIELLAGIRGKIDGTVASSIETERRLRELGIPVLDLNRTGRLPIYVDGADEATANRHLIKGGGGALTREKIVAAASEKFVCIVDETKVVDVLGTFPLPVEVIPLARSQIARQIIAMGGLPEIRAGFTTDNGNEILDVRNLDLLNPPEIEAKLNNIAGVVTNGIFARRPADIVIVGRGDRIEQL